MADGVGDAGEITWIDPAATGMRMVDKLEEGAFRWTFATSLYNVQDEV